MLLLEISNTGTLTLLQCYYHSGSLKVGDNFSVNSQGILTAAGATVSGKITATSGKLVVGQLTAMI